MNGLDWWRRTGRGAAAALLMMAGCKGQQQAPDHNRTTAVASVDSTPAARQAVRVVFIGTSLTAGLGLDPDSAYPARIQRKADSAGIPVQVVNAGVSGETSAGALRRIDWVLRQPADVVVLETGANDGLRALRVDSTRANIEAIVRRIKTALPSARVVLVQMEAPPNLGPRYTSEFRAMFPAVARAEGLVLAPFLLTDVAGIARLNQPDGIHPNDAGSRIVANNLWRIVEPTLRAASGAPAG
jgi:acyl-CoA thioesterase I